MSKETDKKESVTRAGKRVAICATLGIAAGVAIGLFLSWKYAPLLAWDIAALTFLLWMFITLHGRNSDQTKLLATREDPGHAASDVVLVFASVASLAAVGALLWQISNATGLSAFIQAVLSIASVIISWATIHTVYTLRYAREYYADTNSIDFHDKKSPCYSDFAYMAFTVGMTFQVSDTDITSNRVRRIILYHALLSYLFGTVIVAVSINLIAGFGK